MARKIIRTKKKFEKIKKPFGANQKKAISETITEFLLKKEPNSLIAYINNLYRSSHARGSFAELTAKKIRERMNKKKSFNFSEYRQRYGDRIFEKPKVGGMEPIIQVLSDAYIQAGIEGARKLKADLNPEETNEWAAASREIEYLEELETKMKQIPKERQQEIEKRISQKLDRSGAKKAEQFAKEEYKEIEKIFAVRFLNSTIRSRGG